MSRLCPFSEKESSQRKAKAHATMIATVTTGARRCGIESRSGINRLPPPASPYRGRTGCAEASMAPRILSRRCPGVETPGLSAGGGLLGLRLLPVEGEDLPLPLDLRLEEDGPRPDLVEVLEGRERRLDLQVDPLVAVDEVQLAAVAAVAVDDRHVGSAEVGEGAQDRVPHRLGVAVGDLALPGPGIRPVDEEAVLLDELGGEELV